MCGYIEFSFGPVEIGFGLVAFKHEHIKNWNFYVDSAIGPESFSYTLP